MTGDVHVMPNDGKHLASESCPCGPKLDEQTKRARALGLDTANVWVHQPLN